jgi:hypothetical protein
MNGDRSIRGGKLSLSQGRAELHWQLLVQFYDDSVDRYGIDSEQVRELSRLLSPADSAGPPRGDLAILSSTS